MARALLVTQCDTHNRTYVDGKVIQMGKLSSWNWKGTLMARGMSCDKYSYIGRHI